jgi:hypothetical protein
MDDAANLDDRDEQNYSVDYLSYYDEVEPEALPRIVDLSLRKVGSKGIEVRILEHAEVEIVSLLCCPHYFDWCN